MKQLVIHMQFTVMEVENFYPGTRLADEAAAEKS
jgi:hypothetical protein